jgi:tryptophanyl-tRNA synthetase
MNELLSDKAEIDRILAAGSEKARAIARPVLQEAMDIMGFWKGREGSGNA